MKQVDGWYLPDDEEHLPKWWNAPGNHQLINGRVAYQGRKQQAALKLCKQRRTAIDIGAHVGLWAFNLVAWFETVRCFEPVADHRECFTLNIAAANAVMYPMALGADRGSVAIYTGPASSGDSWVSGAGDISMETLDSFDFEEVDFIKIDCEGYEENVIRGGLETIRRCRPVICVEQKRDMAVKFGLKPQGAVTLLQAEGYRVSEILSGDYLMVG